MQTPFKLQALAVLRTRLRVPTMTVFVTDNWRFSARLEALGCLAILVDPLEHHACDWSSIAGLHVILAQWKTPLADESRLASALLAAKPSLFETLRRCCWGDVVYDADGQWSKDLRGNMRRGELLLELSF